MSKFVINKLCNELQPLNIQDIVSTSFVSKLFKFNDANLEQRENIPLIEIALDVSKSDKSKDVKLLHSLNKFSIYSTLVVFICAKFNSIKE